ncbi:MAG: DUF3365 domain-containing protein [Desulfovibrionales bacterium]
MPQFRPKSLQSRFLIGLTAIVLTLGIFFSAGLYFHLRSLLHTQVVDRAELVLSQVDSVQNYVRETLRPKMFDVLSDEEFMIEAMSTSYISRRVMDTLSMARTQYHYRRVARNSRNPDFEMNDFETGLLTYFHENPDKDYWEGYRTIGTREYYMRARPVRFEQACMSCHGDASDAPKELIARYGSERGFGHELNSVEGLDVVGLPVDRAVTQIREATVGYVGIYAGGMFIFFALIQVFFNRLVGHNIRRLTDFFRSRFQDQAEVSVLEKLEKKDEIEEMMTGMEELGDHLLETKNQLQNYAANLQVMVSERTEALSREASERQSDVHLFVRLLDGSNRSQTRRELFQRALPQIGERFKADQVSFLCLIASQRFYSWPDPSLKPELPEKWLTLVTENLPQFEKNRAIIPVSSSESTVEGVLFVTWKDGTPDKEEDRVVLRALGQQMGIASENLAALDNLLRQKDVLQSIVEGISDPLLFMDGACNVILANNAARSLAATLDNLKGGKEGDPATILPILLPEGKGSGDCSLKKAMERGRPFTQEAYAGDNRCFSINMYPVIGPSCKDGRMVVYIRENTTEKRMLARMQQSEKLATVGKLAAGLAHEMNNPLGVILCYAELLKSCLKDRQELEDVDVILRHTAQAQKVLQNLLNFARPKRVESCSVDLNQVVDSMARIYRISAEKKNAVISVEVEPDLPLINADHQSIEQILTNLINNALDALEEIREKHPGEVRIKTALVRDRGEILLQVSDNGPGIPREYSSQIFDPFFTTKEVGRGTGLGLAIVFGLVQDLGGGIEVNNRSGAEFSLYFPLQKNNGTS